MVSFSIRVNGVWILAQLTNSHMHTELVGVLLFLNATINSTTCGRIMLFPELLKVTGFSTMEHPHIMLTWGLMAYLSQRFLEKWFDRGGPIAWPPRSPDLTTLGFFLWGFIKNVVYQCTVCDLDDPSYGINWAFVLVVQRCW